MSWLNPLNWIKFLTLVKEVGGWVISAYRFIQSYFYKRKQKQKLDEMKKAEDKLTEADQIEDEQEHIQKKSEAACEIEKALNPDAKC